MGYSSEGHIELDTTEAFLLRRKCLNSWLQSPSAVIFGSEKNKTGPLFPYLFAMK